VVSASIADVFVTDDDALYRKMRTFGIEDLDIMNLATFLRWIKGGCR
jgi:hypothetical protein